jgi:hypothetical protein
MVLTLYKCGLLRPRVSRGLRALRLFPRRYLFPVPRPILEAYSVVLCSLTKLCENVFTYCNGIGWTNKHVRGPCFLRNRIELDWPNAYRPSAPW